MLAHSGLETVVLPPALAGRLRAIGLQHNSLSDMPPVDHLTRVKCLDLSHTAGLLDDTNSIERHLSRCKALRFLGARNSSDSVAKDALAALFDLQWELHNVREVKAMTIRFVRCVKLVAASRMMSASVVMHRGLVKSNRNGNRQRMIARMETEESGWMDVLDGSRGTLITGRRSRSCTTAEPLRAAASQGAMNVHDTCIKTARRSKPGQIPHTNI